MGDRKRRSRRWLRVAVATFVTTGVLATGAWDAAAQTNEEQARELAERGSKAFVTKDYAMAVTYFQRAASLDPNPVLLYNLSLAHSRLGNLEDARAAAERAVAMGDEDAPADTRIKLRARLNGYGVALGGVGLASRLAPKAQVEETPEVVGPEEKMLDQAVGSGASEPAISVLGWSGVGAGVVGVGLLAGAGLVSSGVRADIEAYDEARRVGDIDRAESLEGDVASGQAIGQVLLYSGVGLAAAGVGLLVFDLVGPEAGGNPELGLVPAVGPEGTSMTVHIRF